MCKTKGIQAQRKSEQDNVHGGDYSTWFGAVPVCDNGCLLQ